MEYLKKLTYKTMGLDKPTLVELVMGNKTSKLPIPVARILGRASSHEDKLGDQGPYVLFKGIFQGINLLSGEQFKSGLGIFNGPAEGMLAGGVSLLGEGGEVPFVYEIGVRYEETAATMYVFTCKPIGEDKLAVEDPLKELLAIAVGDTTAAVTSNAGKGGKGAKAATAAA